MLACVLALSLPINIRSSYEATRLHMRWIPIIAGIVLGLAFVASSAVVLFKLVEMPPLPEGTPAGHFFAAFGPTGYLTFVKVLELLGGILVAIPRTRCAGLLILGPILVNILAFHVFLMGGAGLADPMLITITVLTLGLWWQERRAFLGLIAAQR